LHVHYIDDAEIAAEEMDVVGEEGILSQPDAVQTPLMKARWPFPPLLRMVGQTLADGAPLSFAIGSLRFTRASHEIIVNPLGEPPADGSESRLPVKKIVMWPNVLNLSPFINYELTDERSAYAILLMHHVWPNGDEANIRPAGKTAVQHLHDLKDAGLMPDLDLLVGPSRRIRTDLANNGTPIGGDAFNGDPEEDGDIREGEEDEEYEPRVFDGDDAEAVGFDFDVRAATSAPASGESGFIPLTKNAFLKGKDCVGRIVRETDAKLTYDNTRTESDPYERLSGGRRIYPYRDQAVIQAQLQLNLERLNKVHLQKKTYERIDAHLTGRIKRPLRLVVTGPAGTGKTEIIYATVRRTKILYGRTLGMYGPVIVLAPSGSVAANGGE
jgi:hypothetical protein